jgi:hypothetical protein
MNEKDYLKLCIAEIEQKIGNGRLSDWSGQSFDQLCDDIHEATGIKLSGRTLRRIANNKISNPQIATKNALAQFVGYKNWSEFMQGHSKHNKAIQFDPPKQTNKVLRFINRYSWIILLVSVVVIIVSFVLYYPSIELELNKSKVVFQSNDMRGTAPHKASFFYDVTKIKSSNILIDNNFYDDGEMVPIKKNMHFYEKTFEFPDYYAVKIIANGERLSCVGVTVLTEGWEAIINNQLYKKITEKTDSDYLHLSNKVIAQFDIDTLSPLTIDYRNIHDFGVLGDEMTFETKFKNNDPLHSKGCNNSKIEIINVHGRLSFNFIEPGCDESMLKAEFGDVSLAGDFNNLNTFIQDISYWRVLRIVTGKKQVKVYLDDVQIYSVKYNDVLDQVKGVSISFQGSGSVDYVKFLNNNGEVVYLDEFVKRA